jgi:hypothetical protein
MVGLSSWFFAAGAPVGLGGGQMFDVGDAGSGRMAPYTIEILLKYMCDGTMTSHAGTARVAMPHPSAALVDPCAFRIASRP